MLGIKKAIFSIKKYLPIQSMISSPCKNSKHPWGEVLYFKWKSTLSKTTEWLSMSLVALQEGRFSLLHLFGVVSGTFQPWVSSSYLWLVLHRYKQDVTECFDLQIYYESTVEGNRFWQLTPLFSQHFTPYNQKKKS